MRNMLTDRPEDAGSWKLPRLQDRSLPAPTEGTIRSGPSPWICQGSMAADTSTSRLLMKQPGRVADSPLPSSGIYVDSAIRGAAVTNMEFAFCTAREGEQIQILRAHPDSEGGTQIEPVTKEWLQKYERSLKAPIK